MLLDALSLKIQNRRTSKLNSCEWGWLGESFNLIYCLSHRELWKCIPILLIPCGYAIHLQRVVSADIVHLIRRFLLTVVDGWTFVGLR